MSEQYFILSFLCSLLGSGMGLFNYLQFSRSTIRIMRIRASVGIVLFVISIALFSYVHQFLMIAIICLTIALFCRFIHYLTDVPLSEPKIAEKNIQLKIILMQIYIINVLLVGVFLMLHFLIK